MTTYHPDEELQHPVYGPARTRRAIQRKLALLPKVDANGYPLKDGETQAVDFTKTDPPPAA